MLDVLRPYVPEYKGQFTSDGGERKLNNVLYINYKQGQDDIKIS